MVLDRAALAAMPQHTARLPIGCVQGWSTVQTWSGVRLADLAPRPVYRAPRSARVQSLQKVADYRIGDYSHAILQANQVLDPDALLAMRVNGVDLSPDHGYPARIIVPALPGVHNTKWVSSIEFHGGLTCLCSRATVAQVLRLAPAAPVDHGRRLRAGRLHRGHL